MGEAAIAQSRRNRACGKGLNADHIVERAGGDTGDDVGHQRIQYFGGEPASLAHAFKAFWAVQLDRAGTGLRAGLVNGHIVCHHSYIGIGLGFGDTPKCYFFGEC